MALDRKTKIKITTNKFFPMPTFNFNYPGKKEILNTLFTKYMLNEGYLSTNYMFVTYSTMKKQLMII